MGSALRTTVVLLCVCLLPSLHPLAAQTPWVAKRGSPVRFGLTCQAAPCPSERGSLLEAPPDSLVFATRAFPRLALARDEVAWLQIGHNRHGVRKGALIGGGIMGISTGLLAVATCASFSWGSDDCPAGSVLLFTVFGAGVGAGIGALIGALAAPMQWQPVYPASLQVAIRSLPGARLGLGLSLPFPGGRPSPIEGGHP
jgi:hypothetical protein